MRKAQLKYLENNPHPLEGKKHSLEERKKISIGMIRRLQKLKDEGKPHYLAGRKLPEERKRRQSETMKGRYAMEKHPRWNGGRKMSCGYVYVKAPDHPGANSVGYVR